ncbi:hypothetical protein VKS41_006577 [Umbelopsis sp. WA50703]
MYRQKSPAGSSFSKRLSGNFQTVSLASSLVSPLLAPDDPLSFNRQHSNDAASLAIEQLSNSYKGSIRRSEVTEETMKSAKAFTQVDQYLKSTRLVSLHEGTRHEDDALTCLERVQYLDRMEATMDKLLKTNASIAKDLSVLDDVQRSLDIDDLRS